MFKNYCRWTLALMSPVLFSCSTHHELVESDENTARVSLRNLSPNLLTLD